MLIYFMNLNSQSHNALLLPLKSKLERSSFESFIEGLIWKNWKQIRILQRNLLSEVESNFVNLILKGILFKSSLSEVIDLVI